MNARGISPKPEFERLFLAAQQGVIAFSNACNAPGTNINMMKRGVPGNEFHSSIAHEIVQYIDDERLPALLEIMITKGLDLTASDGNFAGEIYKLPSTAAKYGKQLALDYLLLHECPKNNSRDPILVAAIQGSSANKLQIIKRLIEVHSLDIDTPDTFGQTALFEAIKFSYLEEVKYLLSKKASLTAGRLNIGDSKYTSTYWAYEKYKSSLKYPSIKNDAKEIFDLILSEITEIFYNLGLTKITFLKETLLRELIGVNQPHDPDYSEQELRDIFIERAINPAMQRLELEQEQVLTFLTSTVSDKKDDDTHADTKCVLQKDFFESPIFDRNLVTLLFSYVHERIKVPETIIPEDTLAVSSSASSVKQS